MNNNQMEKSSSQQIVSSIVIKIQLDATVQILIYFTEKSLNMLRVSTAPIIRSTKNCNRNLRDRSYCEIQGLTGMN